MTRWSSDAVALSIEIRAIELYRDDWLRRDEVENRSLDWPPQWRDVDFKTAEHWRELARKEFISEP